MTPFGEAPPAWKAGTFCYGQGLDLALAKKMLAAGEKEALRQGVPMAMAICDSGGNLLAFHRMDHTMLVSIQIAMDKAFTSVYGKMPSANYGPLYQSGELVPLFFHERWITFPGGFPISREGVIMGGLGVSGGVIEDVYVARACLLAGKFATADADRFIEKCKTESSNSKSANLSTQ
jgi:uncharacterized protein GlcG (DUF336 family)